MWQSTHRAESDPIRDMTRLSESEVRVWTVQRDADWTFADSLTRVLSDADRRRAERFRQGSERRRWTATRAALRLILGEVLGVRATDLAFDTTSTGRPFLSSPSGTGIDFNVSHSGAHAVIAAALGRRVGVDIEVIRSLNDEESLVERFFSEEERRQYSELPPEVRTRAFFCAWTRKEAFLKATGRGTFDTLGSFAVTVDPDHAPRLLYTDWAGVDANDWDIVDLPPRDGLASALAVEAGGWHLHVRFWNPTV